MEHAKLTTKENLFPFVMITALFFLWGIAHGLLDVLDKHFQDILQITKANSAIPLFAFIFSTLFMAIK